MGSPREHAQEKAKASGSDDLRVTEKWQLLIVKSPKVISPFDMRTLHIQQTSLLLFYW